MGITGGPLSLCSLPSEDTFLRAPAEREKERGCEAVVIEALPLLASGVDDRTRRPRLCH